MRAPDAGDQSHHGGVLWLFLCRLIVNPPGGVITCHNDVAHSLNFGMNLPLESQDNRAGLSHGEDLVT